MSEEQMTTESGDDPIAEQQQFLAANAEYFAQALSPLNEVFDNEGVMNIVSEEQEYTMVVGMKQTGVEGEADVDCAMLDPNQPSLKESLKALFI